MLALPGAAQLVNLEPDLLPVDEAFQISSELTDEQLLVTVAIADGYYLYRDRLFLRTLAGPQLGQPQLPPGKLITDEFFGEIETYRSALSFRAPVAATQQRGDLLVELVSQGCADIGVCYPPYTVQLAFAATGGSGQLVAFAAVPGSYTAAPTDNTQTLQAVLSGASLWLIMLAFFNAGLLLSFTPCVLPIIPIAMAITTKGAQVGSGRSLALGATYVSGMAVVYTALGVAVAGSSGLLLSGLLNNTGLYVALAALFVGLGVLSWRGTGFKLLPARVNNWLAHYRGQPGTLPSAAAAGAIAALVISPCVAAPLVGALLFISSTGDVFTGGAALFALALGMGVLPLACAAGAANYLPRSGPFGAALRRVFGLLLIALGLWITGPALPVTVKLFGYGLLSLVAAAVLIRVMLQIRALARVLTGGTVAGLMALAVVLLIGGLTGARNELAPLAHLKSASQADLEFVSVASVAQYETATAQFVPRSSLEYYYADWCISCKEIEAAVFSDAAVISASANVALVKVDLSANDADARSLMSRNGLFGPPAVIVRDAVGREIARLVGSFDKQLLVDALARIN